MCARSIIGIRVPTTATTISNSASLKLHDFQAPYSYCSIGNVNNSQNDNVWKITRITVNSDGTIITETATNVAWSDRYSITYN